MDDSPEHFLELVRDALLHLYDDLAYLEGHALLAVVGAPETASRARARLLRQALLDAIEALHPEPSLGVESRAYSTYRIYRILELRYIEGLEAGQVMERVALSKTHYHREHHRALQAVASFLRERWPSTSRLLMAPASQRPSKPESQELLRKEAERVSHEDRAGRADLGELLGGVRELLRPLCAERGVELHLELPAQLPTVLGGRVALRQALLTILARAVRTVQHGPVEVLVRPEASAVQVDISGPAGGSPGYDQLDIEESRPFVEALQGEIARVPPSTEAKRWMVRLRLPTHRRSTALVVDNSADFIRLLERYLTDRDWEIVGTSDVDRALALARERGPEAILLDVIIPGRDGWDLLLALKAIPATRDIPVIVCSVLDEPEVAFSLGAAGYLQKPVDERQLIAALSALRR
ncbi:MAG: response regulator [Chloroflexi bacterium]|nr:response regulator [Chloroflexota bacterium]